MKNSSKLLIFLFLINVFLLESCGENSQLDTISISSNLTDKKIKVDDTLKIKLSRSFKNLTFEFGLTNF